MTGKSPYLLLGLAVLALDQWSKWWVEESLAMWEVVHVLPGLNWTHVQNTGVAFGFLAADHDGRATLLLTVLGIVALTVILVYFRSTPLDQPLLLAGLGLILGGAVGNLADRIAAGAVTDFIDVYVGTWHWHTFNVADSAITVGIGLMLLDVRRESARQRRESAEAD